MGWWKVTFLDSMSTKMYGRLSQERFLLVKWRTRIRLSPRFCDLLDAATFNALLIEFCAASISFTDRFNEVPLA